jgi:hypothetical protein
MWRNVLANSTSKIEPVLFAATVSGAGAELPKRELGDQGKGGCGAIDGKVVVETP